MVNNRYRASLALGVAAALAAGGLLWRGLVRPVPGAHGPAAPGPAASADALPRIALERLQATRPPAAVGQRDVFDFQTPPPPPPTVPAPPRMVTPPTDMAALPPTPPPPPPITLKYIGSVEDKKGLRVALLQTESKEILSGQAGDLVGNRFRIVKIGLESVDIQDLASDRVQRIPLRAN